LDRRLPWAVGDKKGRASDTRLPCEGCLRFTFSFSNQGCDLTLVSSASSQGKYPLLENCSARWSTLYCSTEDNTQHSTREKHTFEFATRRRPRAGATRLFPAPRATHHGARLSTLTRNKSDLDGHDAVPKRVLPKEAKSQGGLLDQVWGCSAGCSSASMID
jgi:hypothetical protein